MVTSMERGLRAAALMLLILLPAVLIVAPVGEARAQAETQTSSTSTLHSGYYNYTAITVQSTSILAYATKSNVSIDTAIMTQQQLNSFSQSGNISNSIFSQSGATNYDALLTIPGGYYLVVFAPDSAAQVNQVYVIDPDINVENSTTYVGEFVTIPSHSTLFVPLHFETLGSPFKLSVIGASNETVQYSVYNNITGRTPFMSPFVTVTNLTIIPQYSLGYNMSLGPGIYYLDIDNNNPTPSYVYFEYGITPDFVNPFLLDNGPPAPTGIAAYGITNESGKVTPTTVSTSAIVGYAQISSLAATDNGSQSSPGSDQASLQLNTVLQVGNSDNSTDVYWPQNVLAFATGESVVSYRDNVLNVTGDGAQLSNSTITGTGGFVSAVTNGGVEQTYYGNYNSNYTFRYTLPQSFVMYMNATLLPGQGVSIQMGVRALDNGTSSKPIWFDKILIAEPKATSAQFVVSGDQYTPAGADSVNGQFYDAELIFGGGAGGQAATFSSLNANLALFYLDQTLRPFPSLYTFGVDTAEAAFNIHVSYSNGAASVTAGTPTYSLLTNDFNASLPALEASAPRSNPATAGGTSSTLLGIGATIVAVVLVALLLVVLMARRRRSSGPRQQPEPQQVATEAPLAPQPVASGIGAPHAAMYCGHCGAAIDSETRFCPMCGAEQAPG